MERIEELRIEIEEYVVEGLCHWLLLLELPYQEVPPLTTTTFASTTTTTTNNYVRRAISTQKKQAHVIAKLLSTHLQRAQIGHHYHVDKPFFPPFRY